MLQSTAYDVAIIGGGPAGSTAGAYLAQQGCSVLILEKEHFPRFHIGESLLPNGNTILKEIGVWKKVEAAGFVKKYGAEFETATGSHHVHNIFERGLIPDRQYTYQVERSRFDNLLIEHAQEMGCSVQQGTGVQAIEQTQSGYQLNTDNGASYQTKWLIDASGRNCVLARKFKIPKAPNPYPSRIAIYNHFEGFTRKPGREGGNIIITRLEGGWCWQIPIDEKRTSMGIVCPNEAFKEAQLQPEEYFNQCISETPVLKERMQEAKPVSDKFHVTADYSFCHSTFAGENFLLTGDAACFTDPIFSSGVYIALQSGLLAAKTIAQAHEESASLSSVQQQAYTQKMQKHIRPIRDLIENFYCDSGFSVFMNPTNRFSLFDAINSVVAGNTQLPFKVRWRFELFKLICRINKQRPIVPELK